VSFVSIPIQDVVHDLLQVPDKLDLFFLGRIEVREGHGRQELDRDEGSLIALDPEAMQQPAEQAVREDPVGDISLVCLETELGSLFDNAGNDLQGLAPLLERLGQGR